MARNLIDRLDVAIEYDVPPEDLPDEHEVVRLVRETLLAAVDDVLDAMDGPDTVLTLPELALDLGEIDFAALDEQAPERLRARLREALADALRRARTSAATDVRMPHRVDAWTTELAQFVDFLASGRLPWHADLARRDLHVDLLARLMDTGPHGRTALLDSLDGVPARTGALRRLVEQFPAAQLAALLALDADTRRGAAAAPWSRTLAAALARADGAIAPVAGAGAPPPVPSAASGQGPLAVVALQPADPLAALDGFLRSGRLDRHAVPDEGAAPAHIALLDAVLRERPAALKTVVRAALAHPDRARRLVGQFALRQLIALVRVLASGRAAALPTLFAALQEARGGDVAHGEGRMAAWLLVLETAVADTSSDAVQERIRTLGDERRAAADEHVRREAAGGGIGDALEPETRSWTSHGSRERDTEGNGGVSGTAPVDGGTRIVRPSAVSREGTPPPPARVRQPEGAARHAGANAGDGAATDERGHARGSSDVAAGAGTDKSAMPRRGRELPALPQAAAETAGRGHDGGRGDAPSVAHPFAEKGGLQGRDGGADTAAVAASQAAGRWQDRHPEGAGTAGGTDVAGRGQSRCDADVAAGPGAASDERPEPPSAAGKAEGRSTHGREHDRHRHDARTVAAPAPPSGGQSADRHNAGGAAGTDAGSGAQHARRRDADTIRGPRAHGREQDRHDLDADAVARPDPASGGQPGYRSDVRNADIARLGAGGRAQRLRRPGGDAADGPDARSRERHRHDDVGTAGSPFADEVGGTDAGGRAYDRRHRGAGMVTRPDAVSAVRPEHRRNADEAAPSNARSHARRLHRRAADAGVPADTEQDTAAPASNRYVRGGHEAAHPAATRQRPAVQGPRDADGPLPRAAVEPDAAAVAGPGAEQASPALAPEMLLARLLDGVPSTSRRVLRAALSAGLASEDGVRRLAEALPAALHERLVRLVPPGAADALLALVRDVRARLAAGRVDAQTADRLRRRFGDAVLASSAHGAPSEDALVAQEAGPVRPIAAAAELDVLVAFLRTGRMPQAQARPGAQVALLDGLLDTLLRAPAWLRALWRVLGEGPAMRRLIEQFPDRQLGALLQVTVRATDGRWLALAEDLLRTGADAGDAPASRRTAVWSVLLGIVTRATESGGRMPEAAALRAEAHAMLARSAGTGGSMTPMQRLSAVLRGELRSSEPGWLARLAEEDPGVVPGTLADAIADTIAQSTADAAAPRLRRMARREQLERLARACAPPDVRAVVHATAGPAAALTALADVLHACARGHRGFPLARTYADLIGTALTRPSARQVERLRARLPGSAAWVLRPVPGAGGLPRAAVVPAGGALADTSPERAAARALRVALAAANAMRGSRRDADDVATAHPAIAAMHAVAHACNRAAAAPGTPAQRRRADRVVVECAALVRMLAQSAPALTPPDGPLATEAEARVTRADVAALAQRLQHGAPPPAQAFDHDGWLALLGAALDASPHVPPARRAVMLSAIASAAAAHPRPLDCLRLAAQAVARGEAVDLDAIAVAASGARDTAAEDAVRDALVQMLLARTDGPVPASWTTLLSTRRALVARAVRVLARRGSWRAALADGLPERMLDDLADAASPALVQAARALLARDDMLAPALGSQWRRRIWRGTLAALDALGAARAVPQEMLCARIVAAAAGTDAAAQTAALAAWRRQQDAGQALPENREQDAAGAAGAGSTSGGSAGATSITSTSETVAATLATSATSARSAPGAARAGASAAADARTAANDGAPASLLPWPGADEGGPGAEPGERIALDNAGIVIAAPYLPRLFAMLALAKDGAFVDTAAAERAVHLVQYLGSGDADAPEYRLSLNKLLCGLPLDAPVPARIEITQEERDTVESLLGAIVSTWSAIGRTSNEGLRQTFLMRAGELELGEEDWHLRVQPGPFDMLMDRLPWGFSIIKFAWMPLPVHVTWR